ncbi:MAG: hypothetical protein ABSG15_05630 [FCB group bacterium]
MKKLYHSIVAILFALALFSCNKSDLATNSRPDGVNLQKSKTQPPGNTPANPAIAYASSVVSGNGVNKTRLQTIGVMDTTGANQTNVYTASMSSVNLWEPTWSPDGKSLSWLKQDIRYSGPSEIVVADISVNSSGVPVAGNMRTIATISGAPPDDFWIFDQAWCSLAATAKIAFIVTWGSAGSSGGYSYLYTVSTSGGAWDLLASVYDTGDGFYSSPCWSPDDSKIAIIHHTSTWGGKILIFDNQTRTFTDSIPAPSGMTGYASTLAWSRSGMNTLACMAWNSTGGESLYYITPPTNGTIPTTNGVNISRGGPSWSPNNSSLIYYDLGSLKKLLPFTSKVTTILSSFNGAWINWKR